MLANGTYTFIAIAKFNSLVITIDGKLSVARVTFKGMVYEAKLALMVFISKAKCVEFTSKVTSRAFMVIVLMLYSKKAKANYFNRK